MTRFAIHFSILSLISLSAQATVRYACDPCLGRSAYKIRAILHGTKKDPFWQQVEASAAQSFKDMGVEWDLTLYDNFDTDRMAADITGIKPNPPDALLVTVPSKAVEDAVKDVVKAGIPVLGLNSGSTIGKDLGILDFVASDDKQGGVLAAEAMIAAAQKKGATLSQNVLFVNDEKGNQGTELRLAGFTETLQASGVSVEEIEVDGLASPSNIQSILAPAVQDCPPVLLSGTRALQPAIDALTAAGCSSPLHLGAFDTSQEIFDAIGADQLAFTVGQQQALQGSLSAILAVLYATTGKSLASSVEAEGGAYLTGPVVITKDTLPSDTKQACEHDAFPVCPNTKALDGSESPCDCTDRPKIKIGGVTHGVTSDSFWDPVYIASSQAALDMGVELFNDPFQPEEDEAVLHTKMANKILNLCEKEAVDGLFVSIPSPAVVDAIQKCLDLNIPVMSINAGAEWSKNLTLMHHIGMLEYNAGLGAGNFLADKGITRGFCINHAEGVNVVEERCAGFKDAIEAKGVTYMGQVYVEADKKAQYVSDVEEFVGEDGDWEGIGILAAGGPQHIPVIVLQGRHPKSIVGAFDVSIELYDAVDSGIKEFGMDQQAYLQGYMPVVLLTYAATTGQRVYNGVIESGPAFVQSSPSDAQQACEDLAFETCAPEELSKGGEGGGNDNTGLIVGLVVVAVVLCLVLLFVIYRMNKLNKHVKELEKQGKEVPDLSFTQKLSSSVKPVSAVAGLD